MSEALRHFEKLVKTSGGFADVHNLIGVIHFADGNIKKAVTHFQEAVGQNPRYTEAVLNLAVALNDVGKHEEAKTLVTQARKASIVTGGVDPYVKGNIANLHADIGAIYHSLGNYDDAVGEYRKAMNLAPDFPDLRIRLGILYRDMGREEEAMAEFERVAETHPGYLDADIQIGVSHFGRGQTALAVERWKKVLAAAPDNTKAHMYLRLAGEELN